MTSKKKSKSKSRSKKRRENDSYLLDIDYIKKNTPNLDSLKTRLKKMKNKRVGLFANKQIKKGEIISYYLVKTVKNPRFNSVYSVTVYDNNGTLNDKLTGDLCPESLKLPTKSGITYWAYFSNEPSIHENANSKLDFKNNYKESRDKNKLELGDLVLYKLIATKTIQKGEEILWCYGYPPGQRTYTTNCE